MHLSHDDDDDDDDDGNSNSVILLRADLAAQWPFTKQAHAEKRKHTNNSNTVKNISG
jgi:hypothetical protein